MTPTVEFPVSNEPRTWSSIVSGASKPPMALQGQSSVAPSRSESKEATPSSQYGGGENKPYRGNRGTSQVSFSLFSWPLSPLVLPIINLFKKSKNVSVIPAWRRSTCRWSTWSCRCAATILLLLDHILLLLSQVCFYVMVGQINSEAAAATQSNHHCTRLLGRRRPRHSKSVRLNSQGQFVFREF